MTAPIPPALDAAEWNERQVTNRDIAFVRPSSVPGYVEFDINEVGVEPYVFMAAGVVALANDALPDGDPRKITREDVAILRDHAAWWSKEGGADHVPEDLHELAAKLAAILPPETP